MRRSKAEAAETREQIVATAAAQFRARGIDGIGINDLMAEAGLTHGGFYRHFASKEALVAEACRRALGDTGESLAVAAAKAGPEEGLAAILRSYLSPLHRDHPEQGCAFAALGGEIARGEREAQSVMTDEYRRLTALVAAQLAHLPAAEAQERALTIVAAMVGSLMMARLVSDEALSRTLLRAARRHILRDLGKRPA